ncbi:hypothetical protein DFH07DRAFT_766538 [Mycena maculata]|uniref:Uncharacterized protein n=1 Tax=Mycena maculata TaxID=230809 RepID=A0AAD7K2F4_9AGAR|nr:hypothetical protein DFH07DRAFT_766538 [Mycena maculata]
MMGDVNMLYWGKQWASEAIANFDLYDTIAEFNSGTYTGVTLYALSLWGHMPKNSMIAQHAKGIISKTWMYIGMYYNPALSRRPMGPCIWLRYGIIGGIEDGTAPILKPIVGSEHVSDAAANVLTPLIAKFHNPYVPARVVDQLNCLSESHYYFAQAMLLPWDNPSIPRNYMSWTAPDQSISGIQSEKVISSAASEVGPKGRASKNGDLGAWRTIFVYKMITQTRFLRNQQIILLWDNDAEMIPYNAGNSFLPPLITHATGSDSVSQEDTTIKNLGVDHCAPLAFARHEKLLGIVVWVALSSIREDLHMSTIQSVRVNGMHSAVVEHALCSSFRGAIVTMAVGNKFVKHLKRQYMFTTWQLCNDSLKIESLYGVCRRSCVLYWV